MKYAEARKSLTRLNHDMEKLRKEIVKVRRAAEPQVMPDYTFTRSDGASASWKDLFGDKEDLFVIHNMGRSCVYCTLWADGFNGVYDHLASRAAFVVATPDTPDVQREFATGRGWRFPMITYRGTTLAEDTGYGGDGSYHPGVSVFRKRDGKIVRVSDTEFKPGDLYCGVWHLFDLLPNGSAGWQPKFGY
jgi:predicted dithiol-disulfide oxidoreductase (DUF899 family)